MSIPTLWFQTGFRIIQKYLQSQQIMSATVSCGVIGLTINCIGNLILMYMFGMGFIGCILATMIARFSMLVGIVYHLKTHALEFENIKKECMKILKLIAKVRHVKKMLLCIATIGGKLYSWILLLSAILKEQMMNLWDYIVNMYGFGHDDRSSRYTANNDSPSASSAGHPKSPSNRVVPYDDTNNDDDIHIAGTTSRKVDTISPMQQSSLVEMQEQSSRTNRDESGNDQVYDNSDGIEHTREGQATEVELSEIRIDTQDNMEDGHTDDNDRSGLLQRSAQNLSLKRIILGIGKFISVGLPGGFLLLIEMWSLDFTSIFIAHMGNTALSAHVIFLLLTSLFHMAVVFAISTTAAARVSTLLAAQQPYLAKTTAWLSIYVSMAAIVAYAMVVYYGTSIIGYIFTGDEYIVNRMIKIAHIVAGFQITYGLQGSVQGCLRGIGRHLLLAGLTFLSFWCIGIPMGLYLCYVARPRLGLDGMWYGLLAGSGLLAFTVLTILLFVNWENEARRCMVRLHRKKRNEFDIISFPLPGSVSVGSVPLTHFIGLNEAQEIEELEMIEHNDEILSRLHRSVDDNLY